MISRRRASKLFKNLQILGLIPLSYIPNSLGVPVLKSQNRKFSLIRKSQILKFLKNATQLCLKAVWYKFEF